MLQTVGYPVGMDIQQLRDALTQSDASVRLKAVLAAGTHPDDAALDVLVAQCSHEPDFLCSRHAHVGHHPTAPRHHHPRSAGGTRLTDPAGTQPSTPHPVENSGSRSLAVDLPPHAAR